MRRSGTKAGAIIQHGIHQHLKNGGDLLAVVGQLRQRSRQSPTRAAATDRDAVRVDPQGWPLGVDPLQSGIPILQRRWEGVVRGQPVVDGNDQDAQFLDKPG